MFPAWYGQVSLVRTHMGVTILLLNSSLIPSLYQVTCHPMREQEYVMHGGAQVCTKLFFMQWESREVHSTSCPMIRSTVDVMTKCDFSVREATYDTGWTMWPLPTVSLWVKLMSLGSTQDRSPTVCPVISIGLVVPETIESSWVLETSKLGPFAVINIISIWVSCI